MTTNCMSMKVALIMMSAMILGGCNPRPNSLSALSPDEARLLREWRPMTKTIDKSYPEVKTLIIHQMTKTQIADALSDDVLIRKESPQGSWYIPVKRSVGFHLVFDSSGRLSAVEPVGGPIETWMNWNVEPTDALDKK